MKPGTYLAKIESHAITESSKGNEQVAVVFNVEGEGKITWWGSFSEKATPHTIKALLVCGLKGNNPAGPLEIGKTVSIVVDEEVGQDGKVRSKVRWVNSVGGVKNVVPQDKAKAKLSALEGAVLAARNDLNIQDDDDEIPF